VTGEDRPTGVNASCSPIIKHKDRRLNLNYRQVCSRILCGEKDRLCNLIAATWPHNAHLADLLKAGVSFTIFPRLNAVVFTQATRHPTSARQTVERPTSRRFATCLAGIPSVVQSGRSVRAWSTFPAVGPICLSLFYLWPSLLPFTLRPTKGSLLIPAAGILRLARNLGPTKKSNYKYLLSQ
jgi:hypothetical protein